MAAMMKRTLVALMAGLLAACSSTFPKVDPGKRYVRYFHPTEEMAYSLQAPAGPWVYSAGKYSHRGGTNMIAFLANAGPYVGIEVAFRMRELLPKFDDNARAIVRNQYFFKNGRFSKDSRADDTIVVGTQGIRCAKSRSADIRHYGPSRDPAISGKWAGGGNTRYSYHTSCPFHRDGRHFTLWVDMSYTVMDAAEPAGVTVDVPALHEKIDRLFERTWQSILFNPALSQTPLPVDPPEPPPLAKPRHVFPDQYTGKESLLFLQKQSEESPVADE